MNRRKFLSYIPVLVAAPTLLSAKPQEHSGLVYWSDEELEERDPYIREFWRKIWMAPHEQLPHEYCLNYESINCLFELEIKHYTWHDIYTSDYSWNNQYHNPERWKRHFSTKTVKGNAETVLKTASDSKMSSKNYTLMKKAVKMYVDSYNKKLKS